MLAARQVFVGVATHDTIALVPEFPGPDDRIVADRIITAGGGPAATAAVAAARLGVPTAFVGSIGHDAESDAILAGLTAEGVDISGVLRITDAPSAASIVVVDGQHGTRAIMNRPPPPVRLCECAYELLDAAEWVHVDQTGWTGIQEWWRSAGNKRPQLSIDAGNPIDGFSPAGIDLYVPTVRALRHRYGDLDREALLAAALDEGAHTVVATDGSAGSFALDRQRKLLHCEPIRGPVISTLGAGDVFHGALLAAIDHGKPLEECLRYANYVAYRSCQGLDGRSAIPTHDEVERVVAA